MPAKSGFKASAHSSGKSHTSSPARGKAVLTERQKWTRKNIDFLRDHIMRHLTAKSEFRVPKGSASQASAAAGQLVILQTSHTWIHIRLLPDCQCDVKFGWSQHSCSSWGITEGNNRVKFIYFGFYVAFNTVI